MTSNDGRSLLSQCKMVGSAKAWYQTHAQTMIITTPILVFETQFSGILSICYKKKDSIAYKPYVSSDQYKVALLYMQVCTDFQHFKFLYQTRFIIL